jgi:hypothetical protein
VFLGASGWLSPYWIAFLRNEALKKHKNMSNLTITMLLRVESL